MAAIAILPFDTYFNAREPRLAGIRFKVPLKSSGLKTSRNLVIEFIRAVTRMLKGM
ncbi:uncharacterized protein G2W53_020394 [Senna tora]|uniref:Uncharacterized protein n=1 Tax=Senna tora TaxID=362788 RepID=A0A834TVE0_9FABA|nr:uncharacterized protein G2W53_020394 [Senna tora]